MTTEYVCACMLLRVAPLAPIGEHMANKTKNNVSLSVLLKWAAENEVDTSDLGALKEAYRKEHESKEEKEGREYNKRHVCLWVLLPNGDTLHYFEEPNRKSHLLMKAHNEATRAIAEAYKGKRVNQKDLLAKVVVSWGEVFNLQDEIEKTSV